MILKGVLERIQNDFSGLVGDAKLIDPIHTLYLKGVQPVHSLFIVSNRVQDTISRKWYHTGWSWKPWISEERKYTNYESSALNTVLAGTYWQPMHTLRKGVLVKCELVSSNPDIALSIEYDENTLQVPDAALAAEGVPSMNAVHDLGDETGDFAITCWDAANSIYIMQITRPIAYNDYLTIQVQNASGADIDVWLNMYQPTIDDYYDDLEVES